jgi:hypothetical protein
MAYIQIDRKLFNHFLWTENRVWSKFEAWIDLIQLVSYTENNDKIINGVLVTWGRGEFPVSYSFLSQRWNWSAQRTRGYMQLLKSNKQINTRTTSVATILTLCNYDQYNPKQQADKIKTTGKTTSGQQADDKRTAGNKEDKEDNNIKKEEELKARALNFKDQIRDNKKDYSNEMLKAFYEYWIEPNKSKTKMRFEAEKFFDIPRRLNTWFERDNKFTKNIKPEDIIIKQTTIKVDQI